MTAGELSVVTGAFGYTGSHIARRLLDVGERVRTLTGHPDAPSPFRAQVEVAPLDFGDRAGLTRDMEGASTLYNTYWIRFPKGPLIFDTAVENTRVLIGAAEDAGVRRIVHISITNASADAPLPYFRGKGLAEAAVVGSAMSHAIIRPTVVFGRGDVLINNIAWGLRRSPVVPVFGVGDYELQPVYVGDVAQAAVAAGQQDLDLVASAVGSETYTYEGLLRLVATAIGSRSRLVHMSPAIAHAATRLLGYIVRDVILTRDEVGGLMAGLLVDPEGRTEGKTRFSTWLSENAPHLGRRYVSELGRHYHAGTARM
jgi:NADH dehydrogenase